MDEAFGEVKTVWRVLRHAYDTHGPAHVVEWKAVAQGVADAKGVSWDVRVMELRHRQELRAGEVMPEEIAALNSALWWLISRGLVYPLFKNATDSASIAQLLLTPRGRQQLDECPRPSESHFLSELHALAGLPDEVVATLEDARECLFAGIARATVVLVGVAYESIVKSTYVDGDLVNHTTPKPKRYDYKELLDAIRGYARDKMHKDDQRETDVQALAVAEEVRLARNRAAHPGTKTDIVEAERLLVLGVRNVASFWDFRSRLPGVI